ncbi:hypothetical protein SLA2020_199280 [Shorea laevis]
MGSDKVPSFESGSEEEDDDLDKWCMDSDVGLDNSVGDEDGLRLWIKNQEVEDNDVTQCRLEGVDDVANKQEEEPTNMANSQNREAEGSMNRFSNATEKRKGHMDRQSIGDSNVIRWLDRGNKKGTLGMSKSISDCLKEATDMELSMAGESLSKVKSYDKVLTRGGRSTESKQVMEIKTSYGTERTRWFERQISPSKRQRWQH